MMCFSVSVMTFKGYITSVINKLTYVLFHEVGRARTAVRRGGKVCYKFAKNYQNTMRFDKAISKMKGCNFCLTLCIVLLVRSANEVGKVMLSILFVCLSVSRITRDCESNQRIWLELDVIIEPIDGKNRLTFDIALLAYGFLITFLLSSALQNMAF